jgi:hypothetical protein
MEPIPFAGWVETEAPEASKIEQIIQDMLGDDPQSGIKYIILADGSVYYFRKEGDRYALCEQTKTL